VPQGVRVQGSALLRPPLRTHRLLQAVRHGSGSASHCSASGRTLPQVTSFTRRRIRIGPVFCRLGPPPPPSALREPVQASGFRFVRRRPEQFESGYVRWGLKYPLRRPWLKLDYFQLHIFHSHYSRRPGVPDSAQLCAPAIPGELARVRRSGPGGTPINKLPLPRPGAHALRCTAPLHIWLSHPWQEDPFGSLDPCQDPRPRHAPA